MTRTIAALVTAFVWYATPAADDFPTILRRASEYVAKFETDFAAIIWHETYDQVDRLPRSFGASGSSFTRIERRHLESEMLFIMAEANDTWLTVRDVISVDGKPVPRQLPALLSSQNVRIRDLRALAEENARFNIGAILRNFNEPTLALLFLDSRYRPRFRFSDGGHGEIDGKPVRRIEFAEKGRPTVVRTLNRDVPAKGVLLVDAASGRVLRTELTLILDQNDTRADVAVSYGMDARLGILVPTEMHESYGWARSKPDERIEGTATYTDFRRFQTSGRVITR
jgi:hypothetical protein